MSVYFNQNWNKVTNFSMQVGIQTEMDWYGGANKHIFHFSLEGIEKDATLFDLNFQISKLIWLHLYLMN